MNGYRSFPFTEHYGSLCSCMSLSNSNAESENWVLLQSSLEIVCAFDFRNFSSYFIGKFLVHEIFRITKQALFWFHSNEST